LGHGKTEPAKPGKVDDERPRASVAFHKNNKPSKLLAASS
jgi:hypothetical protein